jgi:serine/threonine protein kinase
VDRRSDVYSLGVVLYELSTGARLIAPCTPQLEAMKRIVRGHFSQPRDVCASYPASLERVVLKALACDPGKRFQTASELREALAQIAESAGLALGQEPVAALVESRSKLQRLRLPLQAPTSAAEATPCSSPRRFVRANRLEAPSLARSQALRPRAGTALATRDLGFARDERTDAETKEQRF